MYNLNHIKNQSAVYRIKNLITNKIYVGESMYVKNRIRIHIKQLRDNIHHNNQLQDDFNKYGERNFNFSVVKYVPINELILQESLTYEQFKETTAMYNINKIFKSTDIIDVMKNKEFYANKIEKYCTETPFETPFIPISKVSASLCISVDKIRLTNKFYHFQVINITRSTINILKKRSVEINYDTNSELLKFILKH